MPPLQAGPTFVQTSVTLVLCLCAIMSAESASRTATGVVAAAFAAVTFVAPGVLVWAQKYKKYVDHAEALGMRELIWLLARSGGLGTRQCPGLIERRSLRKAMRVLSPVASELLGALIIADAAERKLANDRTSEYNACLSSRVTGSVVGTQRTCFRPASAHLHVVGNYMAVLKKALVDPGTSQPAVRVYPTTIVLCAMCCMYLTGMKLNE